MVAAGDAATLLSALEGACTSCRLGSPVNNSGEGKRLRAKVVQEKKKKKKGRRRHKKEGSRLQCKRAQK